MALLLRRPKMLRTFFAALQRVASNVGLIREAGKEFRLFSHEEVTLVRQLTESRLRLLDLRAIREEEVRQLHSIMARQLVEAIADVERRQAALMERQEALLALCRQLVEDGHQLPPSISGAAAVAAPGGGTRAAHTAAATPAGRRQAQAGASEAVAAAAAQAAAERGGPAGAAGAGGVGGTTHKEQASSAPEQEPPHTPAAAVQPTARRPRGRRRQQQTAAADTGLDS